MSVIPEKAAKILRLALNEAAREGEWQAAAIKFVMILRNDGVDPDRITDGPAKETGSERLRSTPMPFGKFKGVAIRLIPDDYLYWLESLDNLTPLMSRCVENEILSREST